jgi:DNA-binding response OmpR family regulator
MILVAGDELSVPDHFSADLAGAGIAVLRVLDGANALVAIGEHQPDAIVLSADLAVVPPSTVVTAARHFTRVPILLGIGPGEADLVGVALVAGATGLVRRPYAAEEVLSSLRRHWSATDTVEHHRALLVCGTIELDPLAHRVVVGGKEVALPLKEFEILRLLMVNADHVVPLARICSVVWGERASSISANTVATHVARLRQHIGADLLRNVRGVGYRLVATRQTESA